MNPWPLLQDVNLVSERININSVRINPFAVAACTHAISIAEGRIVLIGGHLVDKPHIVEVDRIRRQLFDRIVEVDKTMMIEIGDHAVDVNLGFVSETLACLVESFDASIGLLETVLAAPDVIMN